MQCGFVRCCKKKETAFGNEMGVVLVHFFTIVLPLVL